MLAAPILEDHEEVTFHYVRWHINDWIQGTRTMSLEIEGAYMRFLARLYQNGRPLPNDDRYMSRLMALDIRVWKRLKEALIKLGKIVVRSCLLSNHRFEQERLKRADDLRKRAAMLHARLGGRAELPSDFPETSGESSGEVGAQVSEKTNDFNGADDQASRVTNNHKPIAKKERKKDMSPDQLSLMPGDPPKVGVVKEAQRLYNEVAKRCGIPQSRVVNPKLEKDIRLRLDEIGGLDGWREALSRVEASSFLRGKNNRGWKATIDFLAQPSSMAKLMNGAYRADMGTVAADGPAGGEPVFRYAREAFSGDFSKVPLSMRIMVENDERMKRGEELLPEPAECG